MEKVKYGDRDKATNELMVALRMANLGIDYPTTDLVKMVLDKIQEKGDNFNLRDSTNIEIKHELKWNTYFKNLKKEEANDG